MSIPITFYNIIFPILIPIGLGFALNAKFKFHLFSFSKLLLYCYIPSMTFIKIYESKLSAHIVITVLSFLIIQFCVLLIIGFILTKVLKFKKESSCFLNSILLTNCGNIGIPLNDVVFNHDPFAMSIQIIVVIFEMVTTFTFGLINVSRSTMGMKKSVVAFFKAPVFYAILLAVLFNIINIRLPNPIETSLSGISKGMTSFALLTMGAQISGIKINQNMLFIAVSSLMRLLLAPICAFFIIKMLGITGVAAQVLFIASAIPASRNSAALALEYNSEPQLAAQTVLISTLLSSITLAIVINLATTLH